MNTMGLTLTIPTVFLDASSMVHLVRVDPILAEGSLILLDLTHPLGEVDGVPANDTVIPNVAQASVDAYLGETTLPPRFTHDMTETDGLIERTGKGGLHVIYDQSGPAGEAGALIGSVAGAIRTHLYENPTNDLYFSVWARYTRPTITSGNAAPAALAAITNLAGATSNFRFVFKGVSAPDVGPPSLGTIDPPAFNSAEIGPFIQAAGSGGWTGTPAGDDSLFAVNMCMFGAVTAWAGFNVDKAPSVIFYRGYLEDLTVSGRTFAEVAAIDQAMFDEAFADGGRLADDTFTDPEA